MLKELKNKLAEVVGEKENYTLEDCLIAIDKKELKNKYGDKTFVMINTNGMFETDLYNWEEEPVFWKMNKLLQDQSDETKDFLWDLICKK